MRFCQIQRTFTCSEDACKLGKEYLNALTCKLYSFSRQNSETSDISHAFLPLGLTVESYQLSKQSVLHRTSLYKLLGRGVLGLKILYLARLMFGEIT